VEQLVLNGSAAWCEIIRLELWAGVRSDQERAGLNALNQSLPLLPINVDVWNRAVTYASQARAAGITAPANDLLIYACAKYHSCGIDHSDHHFDLLATAV
jgi:predicted nucleic acid-binding protein